MLVHRTASRLQHKNVSAAHVLLNLRIGLPVTEAGDQGLPSGHAEKRTDLIGKRLIGGTGEDLELIVDAAALRLALRFFVGAHLTLLFRYCRKSRHRSF